MSLLDLVSNVARGLALTGWGGVVHVITPDEIITKKLKGRPALGSSIHRSCPFLDLDLVHLD